MNSSTSETGHANKTGRSGGKQAGRQAGRRSASHRRVDGPHVWVAIYREVGVDLSICLSVCLSVRVCAPLPGKKLSSSGEGHRTTDIASIYRMCRQVR